MSRLSFSSHRGESWMDTNMEPVFKVVAGVVLLHNPWKKRDKKTVRKVLFFLFAFCLLTSFAVSTLRPINALATQSFSSKPIKRSREPAARLLLCSCQTLLHLLRHEELASRDCELCAPSMSAVHPLTKSMLLQHQTAPMLIQVGEAAPSELQVMQILFTVRLTVQCTDVTSWNSLHQIWNRVSPG